MSLTRFNDIVILEESGTVEIGAGLTWADVYAYLVPKGVNVVGGRLAGVGVAGYTLGGGNNFLTHLWYDGFKQDISV
jgi:FAD/FMN-containing dehydrogenase